MRILHIVTRFRTGGCERNMANAIRWERERGHNVELAVGSDSLPDLVPPGTIVHAIPRLVRSVSPLDDVRAYRDLRSLIAQGSYDVVHTHQSKAGILGRLAARDRASAIVHTVHMASFGPTYSRPASAVFLALERWCARFTDVLVTVGGELGRLYQDGRVGTRDLYLVVHSPIDLEAFAAIRDASAEDRAEARRRFGLALDGRLAITVAALEPRKRVDLILRELAPELVAGGLLLAIAGDGWARAELESEAARLGIADAVHFLGSIDNVADLMSAADVLVHAATVEGVPQVVVQALAAGVPVVATEVIGLREVPRAPVGIAPSSGKGLADMVSDVLRAPPRPVEVDAFEPWTSGGVDRELAALSERIGHVVGRK